MAAGPPPIQVTFSAAGVQKVAAEFTALQRSASRAFGQIRASAQQTRASLEAIGKPVVIAIKGLADVAKTTLAVGGLAAGLAALEIRKDLDAGQDLNAINSGLKVAASSAYDTAKALHDMAEQAEVDRIANGMDALSAASFKQAYAARKAAQDTIAANRHQAQSQLENIRISKLSANQQRELREADQTQAAALEMANLERLTNKYGISLRDAGKAYAGFANATKGTAAQGRVTMQTFEATIQASKGLNLQADALQGIITAESQISAKGKASAEELQQIAERGVPAYAIAARAFGVTGAEFSAMLYAGIPAAEFLDKFGRQLATEYGPAAEKAGALPAASFARLENAAFKARAAIANGVGGKGASSGVAALATSVENLVNKLQETGAFARLGERIGAGLEKLPGVFIYIGEWVKYVAYWTGEWFRLMGLALGLDFTGFGSAAGAVLSTLLQNLVALAFQIPYVVGAFRLAFEGKPVDQRYAWVQPFAAFVRDQLIPILGRIPGILEKWLPVFVSAGETFFGVIQAIHQAFFALFGEEAGQKIIAFLVIAKVTGAFSAFAGVIGTVTTVVRGLMGLFTLFTSPAGPIILLIAGLALLAVYAYTHCETFRKIVDATFGAIWATIKAVFGWIVDGMSTMFKGLGEIWDGITSLLTDPIDAAYKIIKGLFDLIVGLVEASPIGWVFKGGRAVFEASRKALGFAEGGYVRGPGTSTSDSIPARLSNREGVINADATAHYGGEQFINALNAKSWPAQAPASVVEVSGAGPGRPVSGVFPGMGMVSGYADDDLADGLERVMNGAVSTRGRTKRQRGYRA